MEISNELRDYVRVQDKRINVALGQELTSVYKQITGKKRLDLSCASCINTAVKIVRNYIDHHEPVAQYELEGEPTGNIYTLEFLESLSLSELRELDSSIKSNSSSGWIAKYIAKHGI